MTSTPSADFFNPETVVDPFAFFEETRSKTPVLEVIQPGREDRRFFLVTRYDLIRSVIMNPDDFSSDIWDLFTESRNGASEAAAIAKTGWDEVPTLVNCDPPAHTRFRYYAVKSFSPLRIKRMEEQITSAVDMVIDRFIGRGECDFIREFANVLPMYMLLDLMGVDRSHYEELKSWDHAYNLRNGQMGTPEEQVDAARKILEFQDFAFELMKDRRKNPKEDFVSDLVNSVPERGNEALNDVEVMSMIQMLMPAGNETTRGGLIAMMAHLLENDGEQYQRVKNDRSLVKNAVEETLRFGSPVSMTYRIARRDLELAGVKIPKGATLLLRVDAANRDPDQYENPDKFDVSRPNASSHLGFGIGIHFCMGQPLARKELNVALSRILDRLDNPRLIAEKCDMRIRPNFVLREIRELHIAFDRK